MELEQQRSIERAIRVLPHVPSEYRAAQASRIAGTIYPQLREWARGWARKNGDTLGVQQEDVTQVAALAVLEILREYAAGGKHQNVDSWFPYLYKLAQARVTRYYKSGAVTPLSGRISLERRLARIPQAIDRLRHEMGREPTALEVVTAHNAAMHVRQVDPAKHGSLITLFDAQAFL